MRILLALMFSVNAFATVLVGRTYSGEACSLTIEDWKFNGGDQWYNLEMTVRSNWQLAETPSIVAKKSQSYWSLYGAKHYDKIAIDFRVGELSPQGIIKYSFQTYDENRGGLIQELCRF